MTIRIPSRFHFRIDPALPLGVALSLCAAGIGAAAAGLAQPSEKPQASQASAPVKATAPAKQETSAGATAPQPEKPKAPAGLSEVDNLRKTIVKLQAAIIDRDREKAKHLAEISRLTSELAEANFAVLNNTANALAAEFVTKLGGRAGVDGYDWDKDVLRKAPEPTPKK
jgi:hypothetical protein